MSSDVTANSRTVVHKGDGIVNVSALPDVCKTPTPAGPTPVPYPNVARSSDLADGAKHVTIEGNPVALENSKLKQSSGDEAGTLGGVVSGKNRGKMTWGTSSPDVCVEGKGVIRFAELTHHNCNSYNVIDLEGGLVLAVVVYGDDAACPICNEEAPPHPSLADSKAIASANQLMDTFDSGVPINKKKRRMLAVAVCECGKKFASMSGIFGAPAPGNGIANETMTAEQRFHSKANGLGIITCPSSGKLHRGDVVNKLMANMEVKIGPGMHGYVVEGMKLLERIHPIATVPNPVGQCAGPRVLSLAMEHGHRPVSLCEIWTGTETETKNPGQVRKYSLSQWKARFFSGRPAPTNIEVTSGTGQQAPSCDTCKRQIPALICVMPDKCPGK